MTEEQAKAKIVAAAFIGVVIGFGCLGTALSCGAETRRAVGYFLVGTVVAFFLVLGTAS